MSPKVETPLSRQIPSDIAIWLVSSLAGFFVFALAILLQWLIYDDWLHDRGPLRLVGSFLAGLLMFSSAWRWQTIARQRKLEMLRRFETIKWMTDRIRNALQAIECITYVASPDATEPVRNSVDVIEGVLREVLAEHRPSSSVGPIPGSVTKSGRDYSAGAPHSSVILVSAARRGCPESQSLSEVEGSLALGDPGKHEPRQSLSEVETLP